MKVPKDKSEVSKNLKLYSKYSSIAVQMLVVILLGAFGGIKLDEWIGWDFPVLTVFLSILAVIFAIYLVTKDLLKKGDSEKDRKKS